MNGSTTKAPIVIDGLRKSFGEQKVLNGIDLIVNRGETLAVLGRSGTGKSVLLKLIVGLQQPDSGAVRILGEEVTKLNQDRLNEVRKKIGFLFQSAALYDSRTLEENVAFPMARHTKMTESERRSRARELLSAVGIGSGFDKLPSQISGGMQKRVGLARALALDPVILLFDEPTAGLDPITAAEIAKLIVEQQNKRSITSVVVTHEIHSAKIYADRFVPMNDGKILADGAFEDLEKSRNKFVAEFIREAA
jgi:phospholipid/cholesterol/gamma-HCH transport system ATP-binding protein